MEVVACLDKADVVPLLPRHPKEHPVLCPGHPHGETIRTKGLGAVTTCVTLAKVAVKMLRMWRQGRGASDRLWGQRGRSSSKLRLL